MSTDEKSQAPTIDATGCCPRFDPEPWYERLVDLDSRLFVHDRVHSVMHIPLDFGRVISRSTGAIGDAIVPDGLVLCDEKSAWGTDVFVAVTRAVPGQEMVKIPGTFLATVHEGTYRQISEFSKPAVAAAELKGISSEQLYFWYTTCPKCAKAYGENYIVILVGPRSN